MDNSVSAFVSLISKRKTGFEYKDMHEDMGPYFYDAPVSLLNKLTPTTNENAMRWREKCRQNIALKKSKNMVKLNEGDEVSVEKYSWAYNRQKIEKLIVHDADKRQFYWPSGGIMFTLSKKQVDTIKKALLQKVEA